MIIGIDIRDLRLAKTGQKTTLEEICKQFRLMEDDTHTFYFFDTSFPVYTGRNKFMLLAEHIRQQAWKQVMLPYKAWRKKCDVVYCNDYFAPYIHLGYKTVQVFHDAFFYEYPQHYNRIWLLLFKHIAIPAAKRSSFIIAPSHYAKNRIHHYTRIPAEKLVTVYEGPKTLSQKEPGTLLPEWLPVTNGYQYILHVGVMEKRKNLSRLIAAFKRLREEGHTQFKLVLVGQGNGKMHSDDTLQIRNTIKENQLENDVITPGYLSDEILSIVYQHTFMYVFPSINEGFGIPILEAFQFGVPVLTANNTCLPEIGGEAVLTFDPYDEADICKKMQTVIEDEALRKALSEKGRQRLQDFSWKKAATELIHLFEKTVS